MHVGWLATCSYSLYVFLYNFVYKKKNNKTSFIVITWLFDQEAELSTLKKYKSLHAGGERRSELPLVSTACLPANTGLNV